MKKKLNLAVNMAMISLLAGIPAYAAPQMQKGKAPVANKQELAKPAPKEASEENKAEDKGDALTEGISISLKVPLFSPLFSSFPVATVNEEKITLDELNQALAALHQTASEEKGAGGKNFNIVLNRLINSKLIVVEAENMELDQLPQIKETLEEYQLSTLRDELKMRQIKNAKADMADVKAFYKEAAKEWKVRSVRFEKEEKAKAMEKALAEGGDFNLLADKALADASATGTKTGDFLKPNELLPQIAAIIATLKPGSTSGVITVGPAFMILKLEDIRYPSGNAEAQALAQQQALELKRLRLLADYAKKLTAKHVKVNKALLNGVDFEAPTPGFKQLLKDKRVVAEMKNGRSVTVAALAAAMEEKFFHGMEQAIKEKKVNDKKVALLDEMLYKRIYVEEAKRQGLDKNEAYRKKVADFRDSLLFGAFIEKVAAPEVRLSEEELKGYYQEHLKEYSSPEMIRMMSLAFTKKEQAESAAEKLRKGSEFQWVKTNAEGQADLKAGAIELDGTPLVVANLPDEIGKAAAGAKKGEVRIAATKDGFFYVLSVNDVIAGTPQSFEESKKVVTKKVFNAKLNKVLDDWAAKLKETYPVKVFVTDLGK